MVSVSRVQHQAQYQASIMLVASMNPCPCGYYGGKTKKCRCSANEIRRYLDRVSGPLLDRIDIQIEVDAVPVQEINQSAPAESSAQVRARVAQARKRQQERYRKEGIHCDAQLDARLSRRYCELDAASTQILHMAVEKMGMSMRAYGRVLQAGQKPWPTCAAQSVSRRLQVAEAIQHRKNLSTENIGGDPVEFYPRGCLPGLAVHRGNQ